MTSNAQEGIRILGSLRFDEGEGAVRMEDRLDAGCDEVWSALTDPGRLARWLGDVEGELRPGGEFRARFFASGWEGTGRVEVCEPSERLLVLTRDADDPDSPFGHAIEVTLAADGDRTNIVWEERGMPENLLAAYGAGVQIHVEDLGAYLAGGEPRDTAGDAGARWTTLLPAYEELAR